ncbi:hypothetical protein F2Q68_00010304 [Brassica cretica]|uniref:Retrotransposon gag domain-containing protein n=1 Tax=Brassica cretica TaxID=69181 RepID=A0A8S9KTH6_BRACR|nr:hypothetical protein F2Q68_00010304 [Brassica cretica]
MHGLMSYRRFGRARSLRSDRASILLGRCVATLFEHLSDVSCFLRKDFRTYVSVPGTTMKRGFLGPSKKEHADSRTIRKSTREASIDTLQASSIDSNTTPSIDITCGKAEKSPEDHHFCKLFPYTLAGDATHLFKKLPPRSLTTWNDMRDAFLNKFL